MKKTDVNRQGISAVAQAFILWSSEQSGPGTGACVPRRARIPVSRRRSPSPRGHSKPVPRSTTAVFRTTARVSKPMLFGAATVALRPGARERTQKPIFRQNAKHFTWFPSAGEQALTEPRAVTGVFTKTRQQAATHRRGAKTDENLPNSATIPRLRHRTARVSKRISGVLLSTAEQAHHRTMTFDGADSLGAARGSVGLSPDCNEFSSLRQQCGVLPHLSATS